MNHSMMIWLACAAVAAIPSPSPAADRDAGGVRDGSQHPTMFVTSVTGTGNLATWFDSPGLDGLLGADTVCRARAAAAGLSDASMYVAWLSDSSDDAWCRAHQLTGTKASHCGGQPSLPSFAGPWIRTDGEPFASKIYLMQGFHGQVYAPPLFDEFGNRVTAYRIFTATDAYGVYSGGDSDGCNSWGGEVGLVTVGIPERTTVNFSLGGSAGCGGQYALLCLLPLQGLELTPQSNQGALAFMISSASTGSGRLGDWPDAGGEVGIAAGDHVCRQHAETAGLPHPDSFMAWLSVIGNDIADRITFDGPWVRPDGMVVAATRDELFSGELHVPINQTEYGEFFLHGAWTGTQADGTATGFDCDGWTSDLESSTGTRGTINSVEEWTENTHGPTTCNSVGVLYCLSNQPSAIRIFFDNFATGDASRWSSVYP